MLIEKKEFTEDFRNEQTRSGGAVGRMGPRGLWGEEQPSFGPHLLVRRGREPRAERGIPHSELALAQIIRSRKISVAPLRPQEPITPPPG